MVESWQSEEGSEQFDQKVILELAESGKELQAQQKAEAEKPLSDLGRKTRRSMGGMRCWF